MPRKTVDVEALKTMTNDILRASTVDRELRRGWCAALEWVLHETGNYRGYRYLTIDEVPASGLPGIRIGRDGEMLPPEARFEHTDDTRRSYS